MIPVAEIFGPTIQGEGPHVGMKTLFVRVVGCDFKCEWCDSKFAWTINNDTKRYTPYDLAQTLIEECQNKKCSNIVLTGGNPCLYDFDLVIDLLHEHNISVDIETQGSRFPEWINKVDLIVISPKAPSSKQIDVYNTVENFLSMPISAPICIKIPVFNDEDFAFAEKYYNLIKDKSNVKLYLSVGNTNTTESGDISTRILHDYKILIEKLCKSNMDKVFVLPQVHTLVWGNKQGV